MTVLYRQRPGWRFPTAVRADGVWIWDKELARRVPADDTRLMAAVEIVADRGARGE